jgi:hypothetical protein
MKLIHWSSKYTTYVEGQSIWVRADALTDGMRARMTDAGRVETSKTLVTGGKTYHEFLMA